MKIPLLNDFESTFNDPIWIAIADDLLKKHGLGFSSLRRAERGENIVILVDDEYVLKIYTPKKNGFNRERAALDFAGGKTSIHIPRNIESGEIEGFEYLITDQLPGRPIARDEWLTLDKPSQITLLTELAHGLRELHSHDPDEIHFDWREFVEIQVGSVIERQAAAGGNPEWLQSLPNYLDANLHLLPIHPADVFMHGDVHFGNLLATDDKTRPIAGLFDFADSLKGFYEYEFVAIGVLMIQGQGELQREFFREYGYKDAEIDLELRTRLMLLTILYEHSSLKRYAERLGPGSEKLTLAELEKAIWRFV
jgi:aminoglycoside phosphotransferase (APT) family kinase protein